MSDGPIDLADLNKRMEGALTSLKGDLAGLRTGRASANILDPITVEAYGQKMPMNQVGTVTVPEPRMIAIQVWDKGMVGAVEKAIRDSNLGLNPVTDGTNLRIPMPEMNEERRKEVVKIAHQYAESARVSIRHVRRDGMDAIKKAQKDGDIGEDDAHGLSDKVQKSTDAMIAEVDTIISAKEAEIMQVQSNMDDLGNNTFELNNGDIPRHLAIIMDGNGRWAQKRGLPRTMGHKQGVEAVREAVKAARDIGVEYLTLYSFSSENWNRPEAEITELFGLLRMFIRRDLADLHKNNVCVRVIGRKEGVPEDILTLLDEAQNLTRDNTAQTLIIAFNYGGRDEITDAVKRVAQRVGEGTLRIDEITNDIVSNNMDTAGIPDPDLLIRTSGEIRLSNFLLWQIAYSELVFIDCLWPDFSRSDLESAIITYQGRTRKFGGLVMETGS